MIEIFYKLKQYIQNPRRIIAFLGSHQFLTFMGDKTYLHTVYKATMGKNLNLKSPKTFNEKLQWLKLYDRNPKYTQLVDKYKVRKFIKESIGEEYLIPLIGVWEEFNEIDFEKLPNQFVLKTTHDSGGVVICKDKEKLNIKKVKNKINRSLNKNYFYGQREWPYKNIKPRIIAEEYMEERPSEPLKDFKIMCFNGEPKITQVMSDRTKAGFYINHYDNEWNELEIQRKSIKQNPIKTKKPEKLNEMLTISRILSENTPFVRVDLYYINGDIYFGELTFYPVSGHMDFVNEEDDYLLGGWIDLPSKMI